MRKFLKSLACASVIACATQLLPVQSASAQAPGMLTLNTLRLMADGHIVSIVPPTGLGSDITFQFPDLTGIEGPVSFVLTNSMNGQTIFGNLTLNDSLFVNNLTAGRFATNRTDNMSANNELYFADNGQIRSYDDNHRIVFNREGNEMNFTEWGPINFFAERQYVNWELIDSASHVTINGDGITIHNGRPQATANLFFDALGGARIRPLGDNFYEGASADISISATGMGAVSIGNESFGPVILGGNGPVRLSTFNTDGLLKASNEDGTIALASPGTDYIGATLDSTLQGDGATIPLGLKLNQSNQWTAPQSVTFTAEDNGGPMQVGSSSIVNGDGTSGQINIAAIAGLATGTTDDVAIGVYGAANSVGGLNYGGRFAAGGGVVNYGIAVDAGDVILGNGTDNAILTTPTSGGSRTFTFPDSSGIFALTSNLSNYLPLDGSASMQGTLDMGGNNIYNASDITARWIGNTLGSFSLQTGPGFGGDGGLEIGNPDGILFDGRVAINTGSYPSFSPAPWFEVNGDSRFDDTVRFNTAQFTGGSDVLVKAVANTGALTAAVADADYQAPLTFSNGLTNVSDIVSLGGSLTSDVTISTDGHDLELGGTGVVGINTSSNSGTTNIGAADLSNGAINMYSGAQITANLGNIAGTNFQITGGARLTNPENGISLASDGDNYGVEIVQHGGSPYIDFATDNNDYSARISSTDHNLDVNLTQGSGNTFRISDNAENDLFTVTENSSNAGDVTATGSLTAATDVTSSSGNVVASTGYVQSGNSLGAATTPASGAYYKDNAVIAWGDVAAAGTYNDQFGNSAITHTPGTGVYTITLPNSPTAASTIVTLQSLGVSTVTRSGSTITVTTYDLTGTPTDLDFYYQTVGRP